MSATSSTMGLDPQPRLADNAVVTGPTLANVSDLRAIPILPTAAEP